MGLAAALLVFTGLWHLTEFVMDRRSKDAQKLVPFGVFYTGLGVAMALGSAGATLGAVAVLAVLAGMALAIFKRKALDVRSWVIWAFIIIDGAIVVSIAVHWI